MTLAPAHLAYGALLLVAAVGTAGCSSAPDEGRSEATSEAIIIRPLPRPCGGRCAADQVCFDEECCTPVGCGAVTCGTITSCGEEISCGSCGANEICTSGSCCTPISAAILDDLCEEHGCGTILSNGCGGTVACPACAGSGQ